MISTKTSKSQDSAKYERNLNSAKNVTQRKLSQKCNLT